MMENLPIGFSMALAENLEAMRRFSSLPAAQRDALVARAHGARSRQEMHAIVHGIASEKK